MILNKVQLDHFYGLSLLTTIHTIPKMIVKDPITPIGFTYYPYRRILIKNPKIIEQKDRAVINPKFFVKINAPI
jgi:hypothetical protein